MKPPIAAGLGLATALSTVLAAAPVLASDAGALFDEGVSLLDAGRVSEACPKLEESARLEPAAGTLLNLAACYEKSERRVLALEAFRRASTAAAARGRADWKKIADEHVASLDAVLPKLTVQRGPNQGTLRVTLDGAPLAPSALGVPFAVEPGTHVIAADAPERRPFTTSVVVRGAATVTLPTLEAPARATEDARREPLPTRTLGLVVGGVGVAGVAFGVVSALVANGALADAKAQCPSYPDHCGPLASDPNDRARTWSTISTVALVGGGVLVAAGAALYFWPTPKTSISLGTSGTGVFAGASF